MSISPKSSEKFRPYLSLEDITLLRDLLAHQPPSNQINYLIKTFNLIILKASSGLANPSYISTPRIPKYSAQGLGLSEPDTEMTEEEIAKLFPGTES